MEKANIIKALELCAAGCCSKCPYDGLADCDKLMSNDAAAMLKASETNAKPKYTQVIIFTKKGNLLDYMNTDKVSYGNTGNPPSASMMEYYAKERDIQLMLMVRRDKGKLICRIKCPVNPLPVKGEFEAPTINAVERFLINAGWKFKENIYPRMFEA